MIQSDDLQFEAASRITTQQRAFLLALAASHTGKPQPVSTIAELAKAVYQVSFPVVDLRETLLDNLISSGYISLSETDAAALQVRPTVKLVSQVITSRLLKTKDPFFLQLRPLLHMPLTEVLAQTNSDEQRRGRVALEALSLRLMWILNMTYVSTYRRVQSEKSGTANMVFESPKLFYNRWQVHCKKDDEVTVDDIATGVGLTYLLRGSVIILISTGVISAEAHLYSKCAEKTLPARIVLVDGNDLLRIAEQPAEFQRLIHQSNPIVLYQR